MNSVIVIDESTCALTPTAAKLKDGLDFEAWKQVGASLAKASRSLQWWIGDWLNYGVKEYGDKRTLAVDHASLFGIQAESVRNYMWVCQKVVSRLTTLKFGHHQEVASLAPNEQKHWLKMADDEQWSVSDLRQAIREDGKDTTRTEDADASGFNPLRFALDFKRWATHQDVSTWDKDRRDTLKRDLKPVVELWEKL
jgi:hypothetical protein